MKKLAALGLLAILVLFVLWVDLPEALDLQNLQAQRASLARQIAQAPWLAAALYFTAYVLIAAFSIPGAAVMTLAGGALFGFSTGLVLASFASTIGASLAFLGTRYLLRDAMAARFASQMRRVDEGIARDGPLYLFSLRLIPILPFLLVNILMGLTTMRVLTFALVSQIGMFPATALYVNAGTQIATLTSVGDVLSLPVILSFVALGLLPWLARGMINWLKRRKVYAPYNRPARFDRNLVVIGAGAGGLVASYVAAAAKASVTLIEAHKMGGDCLNYGCVPSKALIRAAKRAHDVAKAGEFGLKSSKPEVDFPALMRRIRHVISEIEPHDSIERYTSLGVDVRQGHATILDPWTVEIAKPDGTRERLTTRAIVIAAGARPAVPTLPGLEEAGYLTSDTLWDAFSELDQLPRRIAILGGGPIGCELAQSFARLGAEVTQVELADRLLLREDDEVSALARESLEADGVSVLTGHRALRCAVSNGEKTLIIEANGAEKRIAFDALIVATGRAARLQGYGLEALGIPTNRVVETNEYLETIYPNIVAAGDVAGPYQLTHAAGHQGWHAAVNGLFSPFWRFKVDDSALPATTFLDPEIARVGLNAREAREKGIAFEETRFDLAELDRAIADGTRKGLVKVLTVPGKDRILGVTIVGAQAGELLAEFTLAMRHGLGLGKILSTIHAYPTMAEANKYAAGLWRRAHAPEAGLRMLARYHRWRRGE
ncbi:MAG: FAD-dependent oxidoreductase [Beijerinckiaceae bacterium]|jgi:pyruvate/2-oxoglutarate dehydrogenase complex dihydrolipoamide dehydrogenase (E3) component/uncharacterized membrane protein YdjX (TVP38/TMEM64 family)|nr:FAD-dependent oxidoreductase [Beijerinckiaceae bacterium]